MELFKNITDESAFILIDGAKSVLFNSHWIIRVGSDVDFVKANMKPLELSESEKAMKMFNDVSHFYLIEEIQWVAFYMNKKDYRVYWLIGDTKIPLDSIDIKDQFISEKKKLEVIKKSMDSQREWFQFWDRVLMYGPTWTGKTYNFVQFLSSNKIEHAIIPVTEGMEDIDMFNRIVPGATGVSYKQKDICKLFEKAEKWEKVCIIFDELNRWSNSLMNLVLKALDPVDGKNYYVMDVIQDRQYVIPQENIIWGATVNLGGKYTGTNSLDEALLDRFNIIRYKWYDLNVEKDIISSVISSQDHVKMVQELVSEIREYHSSGEIRAPISTRWLKMWLEDFMNTWNIQESFARTALYRLVTVDDYGNPNDTEVKIIMQKFSDVMKWEIKSEVKQVVKEESNPKRRRTRKKKDPELLSVPEQGTDLEF